MLKRSSGVLWNSNTTSSRCQNISDSSRAEQDSIRDFRTLFVHKLACMMKGVGILKIIYN